MTVMPLVSLNMSYRTVSSRRDAADLAQLLTDPMRYNPVVVVSSGHHGARIDPAVLAERLGNTADVYLLANMAIGYDFDDHMPDETSVYGGAIRSYSPDLFWVRDQRRSVLRLAYADTDQARLISDVLSDVKAMEVPLAPTKTKVKAAPPAKPVLKQVVEGTIAVLLADSGALVKLADGMARLDFGEIAPDVSVDRLVSVGQEVSGTVQDGIMDISVMLNTPGDAVDHVEAGATYPALVLNDKKVALFPGLEVRHATSRPSGEVIPVTVELLGRADGKAWRLRDAEPDAEVQEALSFVKDQHPWIEVQPRESEPVAAEPVAPTEVAASPAPAPATTPGPTDAAAALRLIGEVLSSLQEQNSSLSVQLQEASELSQPAPAVPVPTPSVGGAELERLRQQVALMYRANIDMTNDLGRTNAALAQAEEDLGRALHDNERLREAVRTERERATRARKLTREIEANDVGPLFLDPAEQFRHEVYLEWVSRIPAASKASMPLAEYDLADGFLDSVDSIQGVERSKIIAVAVEVLTGIAEIMPSRDMHRLRPNAGGDSGTIEHPVLGTAWRVALQIKTASARRLHFWRGNDGKITFATVGVHDEMGI